MADTISNEHAKLQFQWRTEVVSFDERTAYDAVIAALRMGGVDAWCGDGTGMVVQMLENAYKQRDRLSRELAEAKRKLNEWDTLPSVYKQLAGRGPTFRLMGACSIAFAEFAERQLAESERLAAARNKLNGELAMENERLREALRAVPTHVVLDLSEIPDRDSPDDQPHMLLVTGDEIAASVAKWINGALTAPAPASGGAT